MNLKLDLNFKNFLVITFYGVMTFLSILFSIWVYFHPNQFSPFQESWLHFCLPIVIILFGWAFLKTLKEIFLDREKALINSVFCLLFLLIVALISNLVYWKFIVN